MSYIQLTSEERYVIYHLRLCQLSLREIARRLNRSHSTISREVRRNGPARPEWVYWHEDAHRQARQRRAKPRHRRKYTLTALRSAVVDGLTREWSPEAVAGRLRTNHPHDDALHVSTGTIYRWIYRDAAQGGALFKLLRHGHKKRRRQCRYGMGRGLFAGRVSIHDRSACVATRERYGDWEGDTVEGRKGSGHIGTHVERKSRYLMAAKLTDKSAAVTAQSVTGAYRRIPKAMRKTLTLDNGKEFARFKQIERDTGLQIYFADPYSAWQRGANENTNGLLRRYFPKGADFTNITNESLAQVVKKLNHRPRKCLNFQTPHEVFSAAKRGALGL
jgi:transposase, IS30 family